MKKATSKTPKKTEPISKSINSNSDLAKLTTTDIVIDCKYSFSNPDSINGPFGTVDIIISDSGMASGVLNIQTLFGMGSFTILHFANRLRYNGSTGYSSIQAQGTGTIVVRPNPARHITEEISISLAPDYENGTISVTGFFSDFKLHRVSN